MQIAMVGNPAKQPGSDFRQPGAAAFDSLADFALDSV
jgi:hypothetical protein